MILVLAQLRGNQLCTELNVTLLMLSLGGHIGFDKRVWEVVEHKKCGEPSITFKYHSQDGEEGSLLPPFILLRALNTNTQCLTLMFCPNQVTRGVLLSLRLTH